MHAEIKTITPEMARDILSNHNGNNRPIRKSHVDTLARAILRGEWQLNGDSIRFLNDGSLADGQHRLAAIVQAGIPAQTIVVRGLESNAFTTIDKGVKRTSGDTLSLAGNKNANCLAASLRLLSKWLTTGSPYSSNAATNPSDDEMLRLLGAYPEANDSASWVYGARFCKTYVGPALTAFARIAFGCADKQVMSDFFEALESGVNLTQDSPVYLLRERLLGDKGDKTKMTPSYKAALIFKAFRLFADGAAVKNLRVRTAGDAAEKDHFKIV